MKTRSTKHCYGNLFPDVSSEQKAMKEGRAFRIEKSKTYGLEAPTLTVEVDNTAWEECTCCPRFDTCYRLSLGKLELQRALISKN
ncbi:hypothetical protein [Pelagicoccus mobilis]|uniref:Uncharacterized protein n=1 Tax=Pelagicoccus mobilis TaxID=415221 RepID=A0A934S7E6_9BACT|nr:hypothetical protein [Pelagicoccus mobilis]MBK1880278.1 hypothetical protein [Pelagicoccus mobilis]